MITLWVSWCSWKITQTWDILFTASSVLKKDTISDWAENSLLSHDCVLLWMLKWLSSKAPGNNNKRRSGWKSELYEHRSVLLLVPSKRKAVQLLWQHLSFQCFDFFFLPFFFNAVFPKERIQAYFKKADDFPLGPCMSSSKRKVLEGKILHHLHVFLFWAATISVNTYERS